MIPNIRLRSQQLTNPNFTTPKDLIAWMGAIQAQDYNMSKWALGVRLQSATIHDIEKALQQGELVRTHVMRPTWHIVPAEDIRWMLKLSSKRIKSAIQSHANTLEITEDLYNKCADLIVKMLEGNKSLTRQEIGEELDKAGIKINGSRMNLLMMRAEIEGTVCSGVDKAKKATYSLLEERIAPAKELHKDEALVKLAIRYFRSHSPASLNDFVWWSGLSITEARQAIDFIKPELIENKFEIEKLYIHQSYKSNPMLDESFHLLPAYDEYLISYKDRTAVLNLEYHPKAFNNYGIFYPTIAHNGKVIGTWKKLIKKGQISIETSFFEKNNISKKLIKKAADRYITFLSQQ